MQKKLTAIIYVCSLLISLGLYQYYSTTYRKVSLFFTFQNQKTAEVTEILEKNFSGSFTQMRQISHTCFQAFFIKTKEDVDFSSERLKQKLVELGLDKADGISELDKKGCEFKIMDQMENRHFGMLVLIFFNFLFAALLADFIIKLRRN